MALTVVDKQIIDAVLRRFSVRGRMISPISLEPQALHFSFGVKSSCNVACVLSPGRSQELARPRNLIA